MLHVTWLPDIAFGVALGIIEKLLISYSDWKLIWRVYDIESMK
jgi:hypothetical protein